MSPTLQFQAFAQSVYLIIKNRYFDDLTTSDGQAYLAQIVDFLNMYIDELETETDGNGEVVDWNWVRQDGATIGTVPVTANGTITGRPNNIPIPSGINNLLTDENRYVQILVANNGASSPVVSNWTVVGPGDLVDRTAKFVPDMCAIVGSNIQFSRPFKSNEAGGTIIGDVTTPLPRVVANTSGAQMVVTNAKILTTVKPLALLKLGVAKNASLPDIVKGVLSPSYVQKYNDLLQNAIARNSAGSTSDTQRRQNYGNIAGVGF